MSKLIELDAAINALGTIDCSDGVGISALKCDAIDDAITVIKELQPVDAVPVVRCKDCEWWTKQDKSLQGRCARYGTYPTGEWFCAAGRMDGKGNGNETD